MQGLYVSFFSQLAGFVSILHRCLNIYGVTLIFNIFHLENPIHRNLMQHFGLCVFENVFNEYL